MINYFRTCEDLKCEKCGVISLDCDWKHDYSITQQEIDLGIVIIKMYCPKCGERRKPDEGWKKV